jgi:hypothetical protein
VLTLDTKTGQILTITAEYGPTRRCAATAPAARRPGLDAHPRPPMIPGSFQILVIGK